jgi:hypothetical protein
VQRTNLLAGNEQARASRPSIRESPANPKPKWLIRQWQIFN